MKAICVFLLLVVKTQSQRCTLDVSNPQSPFIIDENLQFPQYDAKKNGTFTFDNEDIFYVVCPKGTQTSYLGDNGDHVACKGGTKLLNIRSVEFVDFVDIKCKNYAPSTVRNSEQTCANGNKVYEVGFNIYDKYLSMVTVCFNEAKLVPFYAKYDNLFPGKTKRQELKESGDGFYQEFVCGGDCEWADSGNMYPTVDMDAVFEHQKEILKKLGVGDVGATLLKFPLTSNAIAFASTFNKSRELHKAPYFDYINVVPVWDVADKLNELIFWLLMYPVGDDTGLSMYTGTLAVLTLYRTDGQEVELYLGEDQVPVPKWIWMVLDKSEKVVFYYNHPDPKGDKSEISKVCKKHESILSGNIFSCLFDDVSDSEMREFLDNDLK
ncbi:hypothetical protein Zmor_022537 [Zophobas morio]|uniref:Uncharacterized protein n=1 Tax=Zophobas morio TaxID=2755281 RepID=A0AA38HWF1_9CUCU|nr:hypothetical protein Zmor_022537 [Zophobas morio]